MRVLEGSVIQICERHPLAIVVFRRHGLDPTRHVTLEAACREHGIAVETVVGELERAEAAITNGWPTRTIPALIDHIVHTYHRMFDRDVVATQAAIDQACEATTPAARPIWRALHAALDELRTLVVEHMDKEERVLFPWLSTRGDTAAGPIRVMQLEHADTIALLHAVRTAMDRCAGPEAVAASFDAIERQLCEHIYLEDEVLFRRALEA
jgi:iron-sulfur cluster repair protein YtfE (RIC family)